MENENSARESEQMNTFGRTVMLKSQNMNMFGCRPATNSPESLTPQWFQAFPKDAHLFAGNQTVKTAKFSKVLKCLPLSMLVITFAKECSKSTRDCGGDRHQGDRAGQSLGRVLHDSFA
jgi:hypothetical protein